MKSKKPQVRPASTDEQPLISSPKSRRQYHSPRRLMQSEEMLERILTTGVELIHGLLEWDITQLNARIVAEHAGISIRTVQRYFLNEHLLRDAVLQRAVENSGVSLEKLTLDNFSKITARMCRYLASFPVAAHLAEPLAAPLKDPTYVVIDRKRREALLRAVVKKTPDWSDQQQRVAAGILDTLWSIPSYERLVHFWALDTESTIGGLAWVIDIVNTAIKEGRKPSRKR